MKKVILSFIVSVVLAGCANHATIVHTGKTPKYKGLDLIETKVPDGIYQGRGHPIHNHYFLWGLFQKNDVDATKICHGRSIKKVVVEQRWYQSLFHWFTFGIYSPMQTTIYC